MRSRGIVLGLLVAVGVAACGQTPPPWSSPSAAAPSPPSSAAPVPSDQPAASLSPAAEPSPSASPSASAAPSATPAPTPASSAPAVAGGWSFVKQEPCKDSEFTCVTLAVPKDHYAAGGETWDMTFAIHRATGTKVGTYVVITGGPGSSGIASADNYTSYYPASIPKHFDIVFLDQRGVGLTKPIACPKATAAFYTSALPDGTAATDAAFATAASTYSAACVQESGVHPADLPYFATRQAIEDLEAVRAYLDVPKLHLYGESYGTQFVQTYAAAHPDRIAALYLDGPVDLTVDGATYLNEAARTFNDTLIATVNACREDKACAADLGGVDPLATYDALLARARAGDLVVDLPKGDGTTERRTLSSGALQLAVVYYLYSPGDRELLLRALVAAGRGDLVPLARLAYASLAVDPDTQQVKPDPTYSDAMYYAVECQDYVYGTGAGDLAERQAAFLEQGRTGGAQDGRFGQVYYNDMPCLTWPGIAAADQRPAPIVNAPYPTIVLVATTDPITPVANAMRIANRLTDATVVLQEGGPHVIFGWGLDCPDQPVADYMVKGTPFSGPIVTCKGSVADAYVPLAKPAAADYASTRAFLGTFADQVLNSNDYVDMLDKDAIAMGCDAGGSLTYTPGDPDTKLALASCAFTPDIPVSGTGSIDGDGGIKLDVTLPGGAATYRRTSEGKVTLDAGCADRCLVPAP